MDNSALASGADYLVGTNLALVAPLSEDTYLVNLAEVDKCSKY